MRHASTHEELNDIWRLPDVKIINKDDAGFDIIDTQRCDSFYNDLVTVSGNPTSEALAGHHT